MTPWMVDSTPFPLGLLPKAVQSLLIEDHISTGAPYAMLFGTSVAAVSLAAQDLADVHGPAHKVFPISQFVMVVAPSNERKTSTVHLKFRAHRKHEASAFAAGQLAEKQFRAALSVWKAQRVGLERAVEKAIKNGSGDSETLALELRSHMEVEPKLPKVQRLLYESVTNESLVAALAAAEPQSGGLISAEGSTFLNARFSGLPSTLCGLWSGESRLVDLIGRGSVRLDESARLTVCLLIQMEPLRKFLHTHGALASDIGLLGRFLVCAPPSMQGFRLVHDVPPSVEESKAFDELVSKLLTEPRGKPRVLMEFEPVARLHLNEFARDCECACEPSSYYSDIASAVGKAPENAARLAAILHIMDGHRLEEPIADKYVSCAVALMCWYLSEHKRIFGVKPEATIEQQDAENLRAWLARVSQSMPGTSAIRKNEIARFGPASLRGNRSRREVAIAILSSQGCLQVTRSNKTDFVVFNPAWFPYAGQANYQPQLAHPGV
jgi:hypothetical protein